MTELTKGSTFTHLRNSKSKSPAANLQGDILAFTNPLADAAGSKVGTLEVSCLTTKGAKTFTKSHANCQATVTLADGSLAGQLNVTPGSDVTGAIVGGTGAYANARGVISSKSVNKATVDTITLSN
ncbi:MAG: hypothetical protein WAO61_05915 [Solirubrobacterales bacterium]